MLEEKTTLESYPLLHQ